jgi:hypothetical protein
MLLVDEVFKYFIFPVFSQLIKFSIDGIEESLSNNISIRFFSMIGFNLCIVIFFLFWWRSFIYKLSNSLTQTQTLLAIIPLQLVFKIQAISNFIHKKLVHLH